jgi:hypothetical protein
MVCTPRFLGRLPLLHGSAFTHARGLWWRTMTCLVVCWRNPGDVRSVTCLGWSPHLAFCSHHTAAFFGTRCSGLAHPLLDGRHHPCSFMYWNSALAAFSSSSASLRGCLCDGRSSCVNAVCHKAGRFLARSLWPCYLWVLCHEGVVLGTSGNRADFHRMAGTVPVVASCVDASSSLLFRASDRRL